VIWIDVLQDYQKTRNERTSDHDLGIVLSGSCLFPPMESSYQTDPVGCYKDPDISNRAIPFRYVGATNSMTVRDVLCVVGNMVFNMLVYNMDIAAIAGILRNLARAAVADATVGCNVLSCRLWSKESQFSVQSPT